LQRKVHWDRPHKRFIFTSGGGSASAYALSPSKVGPFPEVFPDYVPTWVPPPTRDIIDSAPAPITKEEDDLVAHDWGHLGRQLIGGWLGGGGGGGDYDYGGQTGGGAGGDVPLDVGMATEAPNPAVTGGLGPASCEGMIWQGGVPPQGYKVVNSCGQGVLRKVRRRRRRRLLTASDKADISYIVATTGKGQLAASLIHRSAQ